MNEQRKVRRLTIERLHELLNYEPETGVFRWRDCPRSVNTGRIAGTDNRGYTQIQIDGVLYNAHRLAWFYMHGEWPPAQVDHRNTLRSDNRIENLRPASFSQNAQNMKISKANTSGFKGVSFIKRANRWRAYLTLSGKQKHLGLFETAEKASEAYLKAAKEHFGPFARAY